jgi:ABC-type branched-subunit amino acid transport system ATPase component
MSQQPPVLRADDLVAGYADVNILHGVSIAVPEAGFVSVIGPNGAGKSTLLKALYGLLPPRGGTVTLRRDGIDEDVTGLAPHVLTRRGMNYVPQLANVFPSLSVLENLEVGALVRGKDRRELLARTLDTFPLLQERRRQRAGTLSGGQRKLLALARAVITGPHMLLLDEPSAGLAPQAVDDLFENLRAIQASGIAILMVEQNARRSLAMSDYGYVLDMGRNHFEGTGRDLLANHQVAELYLGGRGRLAAAGTVVAPGEDYEAATREGE